MIQSLTHYNNIQVKAFGDWNRAKSFIRNLSPSIRASVLWGQEKAAKELVKIVKAHIRNQTVPAGTSWAPLADSTISRKGSSDWYLENMEYYDSIGTWREAYTFYAGIRRGEKNRNGIEIAKLANILEMGTDKIPARPLWGPSLDEMGGFDGMRAIVLAVLEKKLRIEAGDTFTIKKLNRLFG